MNNVILAQPINSGIATYYATIDNKGQMFVKGPFRDTTKANVQIQSNALKQELKEGLNWVTIEKADLIVDLSFQLSNNNNHIVTDEEPLTFLIMTDICGESEKILMEKNGCTVVNKKKSHIRLAKLKWIKLNDEIMYQYLLVLLYRFLVEMRNTINNNILINTKTNQVYSIGEHEWFKGQKKKLFKSPKSSRKVRDCVIEGLKRLKKQLMATLIQWNARINESSIHNSDYAQIMRSNIEFILERFSTGQWDDLI